MYNGVGTGKEVYNFQMPTALCSSLQVQMIQYQTTNIIYSAEIDSKLQGLDSMRMRK